jgi:hypothetical protein
LQPQPPRRPREESPSTIAAKYVSRHASAASSTATTPSPPVTQQSEPSTQTPPPSAVMTTATTTVSRQIGGLTLRYLAPAADATAASGVRSRRGSVEVATSSRLVVTAASASHAATASPQMSTADQERESPPRSAATPGNVRTAADAASERTAGVTSSAQSALDAYLAQQML